MNLLRIQFSRISINHLRNSNLSNPHFVSLRTFSTHSSLLNSNHGNCRSFLLLSQIRNCPVPVVSFTKFRLNFFSSRAPSRSFRRRASKRLKSSIKPSLDETLFQAAVSQIPPRFSPEELCNVISLQEDPMVCFELFNWASQQPRFRHDVSTYEITIKKLGEAKMFEEMDDVVNQVLAVPSIGSETLYNTMIYFFTEARKLTRAINIFKHMQNNRNLNCRPSIRTYNLLFTAFLSRGRNAYINHMYMETIRCLFRQMVNDGIEPDIFTLNCMIKGYVLSLHINDALRIFHQMGVVYSSLPNSFSYDYLIHGLCAQGRTDNARELCNEMKEKGFVPSSISYNSIVNAMALNGEVEEAVNYLWEMIGNRRSADFVTYRTVLDEMCRQGRVGEATNLLRELQEKDLVDGHTYRKLCYVLEDDYGNLN
ncbi:pentatricopeptide repeat-containing protein At2g27800, mitochondrial [Momordica charantia]|uniref:Pentatricopeptide repeat-containing protein At2g27800, mitochondrial n=1 Tax=Momordica charantia TaxID=3673 RepID=A0A6J1DY00_MOMCH|nr:pentatricopeptide repeat-containing protein At2g27800, mitochondrial [Momordica charantia]XP_022157935.1 pentatricopeptide repeat-containing protein At2g27800, mitochondrial [Momordica charantia]XP_022157936.1 pentatricopeptide repeat-containing protein At2g27800, mitochondrial [Momordica charantia]XP_022157937.1 pentatricopeptide repeat-containing protein At2g27800, mitochondrial [Momordica charantia]XP_022157938.1 pentatricopeptide repeat-containing protein At2g27800, mitochondrial [Momord